MTESAPDRLEIVPSHRLGPDGAARPAALVSAAVLAAASIIIAFPPIGIWLAIFIPPAALTWLAITAPSTRMAVIVTYVVQIVLWLWMGRWLVQITSAGYPFYALYLAIYPALFVWGIRRLHCRRSGAVLASWPFAITVPLLWTALETLRGELAFNGYPWFLLAHPLIDAPELVQSADLLGTYFVSFLAAMIAGAMLDIVRYRNHLLTGPRIAAILSTVISLHIANMAYGYVRLNQTAALEPGPNMLAIQTNMPQDNKMRASMEERMEYTRQFAQITASAYQQAIERDIDVDLILWPETMVFGFGFEPDTIAFTMEHGYFPQDWIYTMLRTFVEETGVPMLVGSPALLGLETDEQQRLTWERNYNSAYLLDGSPPPHQRYDKHFLTPFGETMPYISNWPSVEQALLNLGARGMRFDLDRGTSFDRLSLSWGDETLILATPICFEVTMSGTCRRLVNTRDRRSADILVNLSNDGWFGWYEAGRVQHAQIARFRCIEHRLPMVRSVNTGLSMLIDSNGRIVSTIGEGLYGQGQQHGATLSTVYLDRRRTLYTTVGNSFAWLVLGAMAILLVFTFIPHKGETST